MAESATGEWVKYEDIIVDSAPTIAILKFIVPKLSLPADRMLIEAIINDMEDLSK